MTAPTPSRKPPRLLGLETEYAFRFSPASQNPGNDVLYDYLLDAMREQVALKPGDTTIKRQVFAENGGAFCYEHLPYATRGGLFEGATPECAGVGQLVLYQKAQERLLVRCLPGAQDALRRHGCEGELGLLRNCRDAEGHVFGAQENYQAEIARGLPLGLYRLCLALLLPLLLVQAAIYWSISAVLLATVVPASIGAVFVSYLAPRSRFGRWMRRSLDGETHDLEDLIGRITAWVVFSLMWPLLLPWALLYRAFAFRRIRRQALAFLASRPVVTGTGSVDEHGRFSLSEKAAAIRRLIRLSVRPSDRPIFDTGNLLKPLMLAMELNGRPLLHLFRRHQRLQLSLSDANRAQVAEFLKIGTTALILDLVESGALTDAPRLRRPLEALRSWSADPTLEATAPLRDGRQLSALDVQRWYLERAQQWLREQASPSLEQQQVVQLWAEVLDALDRRDFGALVGQLDWVTKRYLLEECGDPDRPEVLKTIDLRYHELRDGYFQRLENIGQAPRLVSDEAIDEALVHPPATTPAFLRGRFIRENEETRVRVRVSWDSARVGGRLSGKVIPFQRN